MKTNICVIGLVKAYTSNVAKQLSDKLGMFFGDLDELMQFELIDINNAKNLCGKDYIDEIEVNRMKMLLSFENTLCTFNYALLNNNDNLERIKDKCLLIYLSLDEKNAKNKLVRAGVKKDDLALQLDVLDSRDKLCKKYADIVIDANNVTINKVISNIKESIYKFYM